MIIADTGFWVALLFRRDEHHGRAAAAFQRCKGELITNWPVLTEACYLLGSRVDAEAGAALLDHAGRAFALWDLPDGGAARAASLLRRYADRPMDLADASIVLLAEHQDDGRILSTERGDFDTYRWRDRRAFENLLFAD